MPHPLIRRGPPGRRLLRGWCSAWAAVALALALAMATAAPGLAEDMALASDFQVPLLLKILTYDRHFESRYGAELTIGVVYAPTEPDSVKAANEFSDSLFRWIAPSGTDPGKTVKRLPVHYFLVEFTTPESLERSITTRGLDVLYVAPGNTKNLPAIVKVAQERGVTTTTGVPDYVRRGLAVGLGLAQDHPQILINLPSARAEGSEFDASLLRISTVVK